MSKKWTFVKNLLKLMKRARAGDKRQRVGGIFFVLCNRRAHLPIPITLKAHCRGYE